MATVSVVSKVKSNTDDGYVTLGAYNYLGTWYNSDYYGAFDSGQVTNKSGQSAYNFAGLITWYMPFWRFDQVDVPQGATIKSAKIRLKRSTWTDSDGYPDLKSSFSIKMLASDNATKQVANFAKGTASSGKAYRYAKLLVSPSEPTYPGIPTGYTQMPPTVFGSNSVVWDVAAGTTTIDTWVDSPDITDVVKEVVDRAGWVADNAMCLYFCLPDLAVSGDNDTTGWVREFHSHGATGNPGAELHIEFEHKSSTPEVVHIPARPAASSPASSATSSSGGGPLVPGVDPPDRVAGLKTWHSAESLGASLDDGEDIATWSIKSGQALDLTDNGTIPPVYNSQLAAYPVANTDTTCGLENVTTDCRFLNPGANEAMVHLIHWRAGDASSYGLLSSVGAREYQGGNVGSAAFRGHDWLQSGYGSELMTLRLRGSDGVEIRLTMSGGELMSMDDSGDYIFMCVRDLASQQVRMFMNGGNNYQTAACASSLSFKHATTDGAYNLGSYATDSSDSGPQGAIGDSLIYVRDTDFTANELNTMGKYFADRYGVLWHNIYQSGASPTLGYTTGLAARYKAVGDATHMTLNGTDVDVWKDISGNGRDLYPYDLNGVTADPPTFDENGWTGRFNFYSAGYDYYTNVGGFRTGCVDFAGVQCMFEDAATETDIPVPYTLIAVCQPPADYAAKRTLYSGYSAQRGVEIDAAFNRTWSMTNNTLADTNEYCRPGVFDYNIPATYRYISQGNNSAAFVYGDNNPTANSKFYDNGEVKQSTLDCGIETSKRIAIGGNNHATALEPWHGRVCEILIYDHEVSAANIKAIHDDYLAKEWGCRQPYTNYNDV